ncbi:MAG: hypothetical protein ACFB10_24320 [Salibacteraceae bacterium]
MMTCCIPKMIGGVFLALLLGASPTWGQENSCKTQLKAALSQVGQPANGTNDFLRFQMAVNMQPAPDQEGVAAVNDLYTVVKDGDRRYFWSTHAQVFEDNKVKVYVDMTERSIYIMNTSSVENRQKALGDFAEDQKAMIDYGQVQACEAEAGTGQFTLLYNTSEIADYVKYDRIDYFLQDGQLKRCVVTMKPGAFYTSMEVEYRAPIFDREKELALKKGPLQMVYQGRKLKEAYAGFTITDLRQQRVEEDPQ